MAFAFGHLIGAWLFGKVNELINSKKIPHCAWLFLLFGGILPDIDFLLDWTLNSEIHRTITHSLIFLITSCLTVYFAFSILMRLKGAKKNTDAKLFSFALGAGMIIHLILDMLFSQGIPLFWPNLSHFSLQGINYFDPSTPSFLESPSADLKHFLKLAILDMGLGTAWIFYLLLKKKIRL